MTPTPSMPQKAAAFTAVAIAGIMIAPVLVDAVTGDATVPPSSGTGTGDATAPPSSETSDAPAPASVATPAGVVNYIIGFEPVPDEIAFGTYADFPVIRLDKRVGFAVVAVDDTARFENVVANDANVTYWQLDDPTAFRALEAPANDPYYPSQYALQRINAPAAWNATRGSEAVTVAVLDTGVEREHPDLRSLDMLQGVDVVNGDIEPEDACGHGTHVTGLVGAITNNRLGIAGLAKSTVLPVKVMDKSVVTGACSGSFSHIASGIRVAADRGADVISLSLGCRGCYDPATAEAIEYAWSKGALLVAASGNAGPCTECVAFPANHSRVIAVGCTDMDDAACSFSSTGEPVEIAAPGYATLSTMTGGSYARMSGTSMSTPLVAGAAALALAADRNATNAQVRELLRATARDLGPAGRDVTFGHGLLDASALVASTGTPSNQPPHAAFVSAHTRMLLRVNANQSMDPDGRIVSYSWNWGDGSTPGVGLRTSHEYTRPGTYRVTLTVTDDEGATATIARNFTMIGWTVHVEDVRGSHAHKPDRTHRLAWRMTVLDDSGRAVPGAGVLMNVQTPWGASFLRKPFADANGVATLSWEDRRTTHGTYTACVVNVQKMAATYEATRNAESCESITTR